MGKGRRNYIFHDHEDIEIAGILLDLSNPVVFDGQPQEPEVAPPEPEIPIPEQPPEPVLLIKLEWGHKRKRSAQPDEMTPPSMAESLERERMVIMEPENKKKMVYGNTSRSSPLSLDSGTAGYTTKKSNSTKTIREKLVNVAYELTQRKLVLQRIREKLVNVAYELTQRKEILQKDLEKVRSYYEQLHALNKILKAEKQHLRSSLEPHESQLVVYNKNWIHQDLEMGQEEPQITTIATLEQQFFMDQSYIVNVGCQRQNGLDDKPVKMLTLFSDGEGKERNLKASEGRRKRMEKLKGNKKNSGRVIDNNAASMESEAAATSSKPLSLELSLRSFWL